MKQLLAKVKGYREGYVATQRSGRKLEVKIGRGPTLELIKEYLFKIRIQIARDKYAPQSMGVPQGSVIGPTVWDIFYDDLLHFLRVTG